MCRSQLFPLWLRCCSLNPTLRDYVWSSTIVSIVVTPLFRRSAIYVSNPIFNTKYMLNWSQNDAKCTPKGYQIEISKYTYNLSTILHCFLAYGSVWEMSPGHLQNQWPSQNDPENSIRVPFGAPVLLKSSKS